MFREPGNTINSLPENMVIGQYHILVQPQAMPLLLHSLGQYNISMQSSSIPYSHAVLGNTIFLRNLGQYYIFMQPQAIPYLGVEDLWYGLTPWTIFLYYLILAMVALLYCNKFCSHHQLVPLQTHRTCVMDIFLHVFKGIARS